jgi:hypothetical protein
MHSVPIVEKHGRTTSPVRQDAVKDSVQSGWEGGVLLAEVDKIGRSSLIEAMPSLFEVAEDSRFGILLAGKD